MKNFYAGNKEKSLKCGKKSSQVSLSSSLSKNGNVVMFLNLCNIATRNFKIWDGRNQITGIFLSLDFLE